MKKYFSGLLLLVSILAFQSCKEEVDLIGNFEETAIVYGLLDKADSVHMVKINRAFIGPGNSIEIAAIPDSNYFDELVVTVEEYVANSLQRTWTLGDTLVDDKDENGIFFAPQQKLYFFETPPSAPLLDDAIYKLHIDVNNGEFEVTAETEIVSGMIVDASSQNYTMRFAQNPGEYNTTNLGVGSGNAFQINTTLTTNYREWTGSTFVDRSFSWNLGEKETSPGENLNFAATGETFYNLMKTSCEGGDPLADRRTFVSFDVVVTGGAEELYNYILVNKPSSSLAQSKPTYTNLSATNDHPVIGIFSSRQTLRVNKPFYLSTGQAFIRALDQKSTQELCIGGITGPFLFCSDHPGDNVATNPQPYACP
ncbi:MAG: hypothetical protein P8P74_18825 [Crocinitomicaceae bacterium]|nr:hypothetical protein [Crocinitomicaceae bacterium]